MAFVWLLLMPFAVWLEDRMEFLYYLYQKAISGRPVNLMRGGSLNRRFHSDYLKEDIYIYSLFDAYKEFFTFRARPQV